MKENDDAVQEPPIGSAGGLSVTGKIIASAWVTLDGKVAGPDDSMDWLRPDLDLMEYETGLVNAAGTLLLGRITHADFASYWPAVARGAIDADEGSRSYARRLDELDKVVASRTGHVADWPGTRRIQEVTVDEVHRIRAASTGNVVVYGSLSVLAGLDRLGLLDEVHLVGHPVFLGQGKPLFSDGCRAGLELTDHHRFSSGAVLSIYRCSYEPASTS